MLPVAIIALIAIPLLVVVFVQIRRRNVAGEDLGGTDQAEPEREFAAAEAYEDQWREQQHARPDHPGP